MMKKNEIKILVIEDEEDIRRILLYHLRKDGYHALGATTGEEGLQMAEEHLPALILLDLMLPGMDGTAVCRKIRGGTTCKNVPILMLTARGEEEDIVSGLEAGADDYVVKPFSNRVLLARVRSLLRRNGMLEESAIEQDVLTVGAIHMIPERREVRVHDCKVELTTGEYNLLQAMMRRPGIVFTRHQLLDLVHGSLHAITERAVDVQVVGLRKKLGSAGAQLETVRGIGYRIVFP